MVENKPEIVDDLGNGKNVNRTEFNQTYSEYEIMRKAEMDLAIANEIKKVEELKKKFDGYEMPKEPTEIGFVTEIVGIIIAGFIPASIITVILVVIMLIMGVSLSSSLVIGLGIIAYIIIFKFVQRSDKDINDNYTRALDVYEKLKKGYEIGNENLEQKIRTISQRAENDCSVYKENYETYIRTLSADLYESKLVLKITDWLTEEFINIINNVDRCNNVQQIRVPFLFFVYCNKVTSNIGEFNFEVERYAKLDSREKVMAVSKVIATQVQLNIISQFPKDISGTDVKVYIETKERNGGFNTNVSVNVEQWAYRAESCITYEAINGYFREEQDWL